MAITEAQTIRATVAIPQGGSGGSTVVVNPLLTSGEKVAEITVDGTKKDIYAPAASAGGADFCVTPEQYGAKGDGVTDDYSAINEALASGGNVVFSKKTYKTTHPIEIKSKKNVVIDMQGSTIAYSGNESAIILDNLENMTIRIGAVVCSDDNANCISFQNTVGWSQYVDISYVRLVAGVNGSCVYASRPNGTANWINEIHWFGGRLEKGLNGFYLDMNNASGWRFYNTGVEPHPTDAMTNGFKLVCNNTDARFVNFAFIGLRFGELDLTSQKLFHVEGKTEYFLIVDPANFSADAFSLNANCNRWKIVSPKPMTVTNGVLSAETAAASGSTSSEIDEDAVNQLIVNYTFGQSVNALNTATDASGDLMAWENVTMSGTGATTAADNWKTTGFIPVKAGDVVRLQGIAAPVAASEQNQRRLVYFNSAKTYTYKTGQGSLNTYKSDGSGTINNYCHDAVIEDGNLVQFTVGGSRDDYAATIAYMRITFKTADIGQNPIISVNNEILGTTIADLFDMVTDIPTTARTLTDSEDELNIVAGQEWGDGAWLALRKSDREDRGGSFELFAFSQDGETWKSLYGDVDGLKWGDDEIALKSDIPDSVGGSSGGRRPVLTDSFTYDPTANTDAKVAWFELTDPIVDGDEFIIQFVRLKCDNATANYKASLKFNGSNQYSGAWLFPTAMSALARDHYQNGCIEGRFDIVDGIPRLEAVSMVMITSYLINMPAATGDASKIGNSSATPLLKCVLHGDAWHVWNGSPEAIREIGFYCEENIVTTAMELKIYKMK